MSWVTWRQHRPELAWIVVLAAVLAAVISFVAYQIHAANCPGLVTGYCFTSGLGGLAAQQLVELNLYTYGLVVLPALAGAFIGCPLVAREIENGTHRLVWTQGVTRLRWLATKLVLVAVPLLAAATILGVLEIVLINQLGSTPNHWSYFDQQAPMTAASTLFALALGVAVGAVMGRPLPAMAVTLIGFVLVRIGLAELARPYYLAPVTYTTHDMSTFSSPPAAYPGAWWIDQPAFYDSSGRLLSNGGSVGNGHAALVPGQDVVAYAIQHFQPADRFWTFQAIESAILIGLAAALIGFTTYWVMQRVS